METDQERAERHRAIEAQYADFLAELDENPGLRSCPRCPEDGDTDCPLCLGADIVYP